MRYILLEIRGGKTRFYYNKVDGTHTFARYGESVECQLILIKDQLKDLCHKCLSLDYDKDHRQISLILSFGIDVSDRLRHELTDLFSTEALGELHSVRSEAISLKHLSKNGRLEVDKKNAVLYLYSDNINLYSRLIHLPSGEILSQKTLNGEGKDPRVEPAIDFIYNKVRDYTDCKLEEASPFIREAINDFLADGRNELGVIQLPDCKRNPYLSRSQMDQFAPPKGATFAGHLLEILNAQHIMSHDCAVVFQGFAAGNSYFADAVGMFTPQISEDRNIGDDIRQQLLLAIERNENPEYEEEKAPEPPSFLDIKPEEPHNKSDNQPQVIQVEHFEGTTPSITQYVGYRKFEWKVNISRSGFFKRKISFMIDLEIEQAKDLPCNCALTIDDRNYKVFKEETVVDEISKGAKGPFQFGPFNLPLAGISSDAKSLYIHIYPTDKTFPMTLFKNNHFEIKL